MHVMWFEVVESWLNLTLRWKTETRFVFSPLASWMRNDVVFIYTPVLVCKYPRQTVGVSDAISATALLYSQFYKLEKL